MVTTENNLLTRIGEILKRDDTILFIGSGLSMWSGLPSWSRLLEEMASFIESLGCSAELVHKEIANGNLLQAASYGIDQLKPSEFMRFIRQACRYGSAMPHEIHKKVVRLGPTCFITTNYDHLIEDAFREIHGKDLFSVTNKQLTETADIIQARASDFIFKPHGDLNDGNSIILTREQYRSILHGDRAAALEALKTLLVSRPIVFLGFGLGDPDFMFVQDYLLEIYKGGACDYYAVMPDISEQEKSFWLRKYGIHILSYQSMNNGKRDHSFLLNLIDNLLNITSNRCDLNAQYEKDFFSPERVLALVRYAKKIVYTMPYHHEIKLPLRTSQVKKDISEINLRVSMYHPTIEELLAQSKQNLILIGNPGAGKTYTLKHYCLELAEELESVCLNEMLASDELTIPLYIDLKLYSGHLWQLAEEMLPSLLRLQEFCDQRRVIFILDSYNELPREYVENNLFQKDFASFLQVIKKCRLIIASRTEDGLDSFGMPIFRIDEIDQTFVSTYLTSKGISLRGPYEADLLNLLTKPLYFRLYSEGKIAFHENAHPRQVYASLFTNLAVDFEQKYHFKINFENILSKVAYNSLNKGQETISLEDLKEFLDDLAIKESTTAYNSDEIINWLISHTILVPAPKSRLSFFHQSVTEYLAACDLAHRYMADPNILNECLQYMRWDQALYLTLGFLDTKKSQTFIHQIMETSLLLAIRSTKYIEAGRENIITEILDIFCKEADHKSKYEKWGMNIHYALSRLPVTPVHEERLWKLLKLGQFAGSAAAKLLLYLRGGDVKGRLINEMFRRPKDYNFCVRTADALCYFVDYSDLAGVINRFENITFEDEEEIVGILAGSEQLFSLLDADDAADAFFPLKKLSKGQRALLRELLRASKTNKTNRIKAELIKYGDPGAIFPLNLTLIGDHNSVDPNIFDEDTTKVLLQYLSSEKYGQWTIDILKYICESRRDLASIVKECAMQLNGIMRIILFYCLTEIDQGDFWQEMEQFSRRIVEKEDIKNLHLFSEININWTNHTDMLVRLLKQRNQGLAYAVLATFDDFDDIQPWNISLDPLEWWLDFLNEKSPSDVFIDGEDFHVSLGSFIVNHSTKDTHQKLVAVFNQAECPPKYKRVLSYYVLNNILGLTTDFLSTSAIEYLIHDLHRRQNPYRSNHLLGQVATEKFVLNQLIPLLKCEKEPFRTNLYSVLRDSQKINHPCQQAEKREYRRTNSPRTAIAGGGFPPLAWLPSSVSPRSGRWLSLNRPSDGSLSRSSFWQIG